ncbi:hypothetical protein [Qipengyuania flava]|uniref:hypothetical protein n=1 Tax=Qipengyuania flava TaxID=192812 RepID=UPI00128FFF4C
MSSHSLQSYICINSRFLGLRRGRFRPCAGASQLEEGEIVKLAKDYQPHLHSREVLRHDKRRDAAQRNQAIEPHVGAWRFTTFVVGGLHNHVIAIALDHARLLRKRRRMSCRLNEESKANQDKAKSAQHPHHLTIRKRAVTGKRRCAAAARRPIILFWRTIVIAFV